MKLYIIDIILVVFLFLMAILGYKKGFVVRLYDLLTTLAVLFLANLLATPVSFVLKIYKYDEADMIASLVGQVINRILVFIVLVVGLLLVKKLLGMIIKPILSMMTHAFHFTKWLDQSLGMILSFVQGIVMAYVFFVFIMIPFVNHGKDYIQQSTLSMRIVNLVPNVSEDVFELSSQIQRENRNAETLTKLMIVAYDNDMIDHDSIKSIFDYVQTMNQGMMNLSKNDYEKLQKILLASEYSDEQIKSILLKVNVSDEK